MSDNSSERNQVGRTSDVLIVGAGPVGLTTALYLAQYGWQVTVLERWPAPYAQPRAVHYDDEIARLLELYRDMDDALGKHAWLAGDSYSIADAAFTPYVVRLDHLDVLGMLDPTPRVADWYRRIQARPSFKDGITRWENPDYLALMKRQGRENWPKIKEIMAAC